MKGKCKFEAESRSKDCPDVIYIRCKHSGIKGEFNCIGYDNCADYEEEET